MKQVWLDLTWVVLDNSNHKLQLTLEDGMLFQLQTVEQKTVEYGHQDSAGET
jgi:hypothetical protein